MPSTIVRMSSNEILDFYMSTKLGWIRCHGAARRDTISAEETQNEGGGGGEYR